MDDNAQRTDASRTLIDALAGSVDPRDLAFDIDGVVADTMAVFVRLARQRYGLEHLRKDHLHRYNLHAH